MDPAVEELRCGMGLAVEGRQCGSRGGGGDDVDLAVEELRRGVGLAVGGDSVGLTVEGATTWILWWKGRWRGSCGGARWRD